MNSVTTFTGGDVSINVPESLLRLSISRSRVCKNAVQLRSLNGDFVQLGLESHHITPQSCRTKNERYQASRMWDSPDSVMASVMRWLIKAVPGKSLPRRGCETHGGALESF